MTDGPKMYLPGRDGGGGVCVGGGGGGRGAGGVLNVNETFTFYLMRVYQNLCKGTRPLEWE